MKALTSKRFILTTTTAPWFRTPIAQGQPSWNDDIAIVRVDSVGLLLLDVAWIMVRRLYELYSPVPAMLQLAILSFPIAPGSGKYDI